MTRLTSRFFRIWLLLLAGCASAHRTAAGATQRSEQRPAAAQLHTPRGAALNVAITWPASASGRVPAVVIAPGQGYHMARPIIALLAERLAAAGIAAIRFDWAYCQLANGRCTGHPSDGFAVEREDVETVLAFARAEPNIDGDRIILVGKSLGTIVTYPVFAHDTRLLGLALLTPVCTEREDDQGNRLDTPRLVAPTYYPDLASGTRPVLFVLGRADELCDTNVVNAYVRGASSARVVEVEGDHGFGVGAGGEDATNANIARAVDAVVTWARPLVQR